MHFVSWPPYTWCIWLFTRQLGCWKEGRGGRGEDVLSNLPVCGWCMETMTFVESYKKGNGFIVIYNCLFIVLFLKQLFSTFTFIQLQLWQHYIHWYNSVCTLFFSFITSKILKMVSWTIRELSKYACVKKKHLFYKIIEVIKYLK